MQYKLNWIESDTLFFIAIIGVAVAFMLYFFISEAKIVKDKFTKSYGKDKSLTYFVYFQRMLGVFCFGILPLLLLLFFSNKNLNYYGVNINNIDTSIYWILGLSPILIIMNFFNSKKPDNLSLYPQIRTKRWSVNILILSSLTWVAYLLAYEFMFRGFLLFVSLQYLGVWPAIALNISIYSLVHVPKGMKEAIGALPLGIVLGIITVQTSSILLAFVVHIVLALSNEWFSLKHHPDISLKR